MEFGLLGCVCFQAEDVIRDLVRSRGLGDVYKSQREPHDCPNNTAYFHDTGFHLDFRDGHNQPYHVWAVSYTHLTLPTSDLV